MVGETRPAWMGSGPSLPPFIDIRGRILFKIVGLTVTLFVLFYTVQNIYSPEESFSVPSFSNFSIPERLRPGSWRLPQAFASTNYSTPQEFNSTQVDVDEVVQLLNESSAELGVSEEIIDASSDWSTTPLKSDIGKVTIVFGGQNPTYERAVRTHEVHNKRFGYPLHVLRHGILSDVWTKPAHILSLLLKELSKPEHERLKWLLWFDADTVIMNPNIPVSIFLPPADLDSTHFSHIHILVTNDMNGLNNGVFPIRVHPWSVELMSAVVAFTTYRPDVHLTFRDQSALDEMLKEPRFRDNVAYLPQRWFNAYQGELNETLGPFQMRRGDFLVHFAGVPNRDERMRLWMERAEQHLPEWEIDLIHTSYPTETREYWEERRLEIETRRKALKETIEGAEHLLESTESLLREFSRTLSNTDREQIPSRVAELRKILAEQRENKPALEIAIDELRAVASPLRSLEETSRKAAIKSAHTAIFDAESVVVNLVNDGDQGSHSEKVKGIENMVDKLREMVVRRPEDREGVTMEAGRLTEAMKQLEAEVQREEDEKASKAKIALEVERVGGTEPGPTSSNAVGQSGQTSPDPVSPDSLDQGREVSSRRPHGTDMMTGSNIVVGREREKLRLRRRAGAIEQSVFGSKSLQNVS